MYIRFGYCCPHGAALCVSAGYGLLPSLIRQPASATGAAGRRGAFTSVTPLTRQKRGVVVSTTPLRSPYMPLNTRRNRPAVKRGAVALKYIIPKCFLSQHLSRFCGAAIPEFLRTATVATISWPSVGWRCREPLQAIDQRRASAMQLEKVIPDPDESLPCPERVVFSRPLHMWWHELQVAHHRIRLLQLPYDV